jgi:HK97 family phage major capsid protein
MKLNKRNADFAGWVTRNNLRCADGRVIRHGAFKDQDGSVVPLVWSHQHNDPELVLGKCLLEDRKEGVYGYAFLNNGRKARQSKDLVEHGDINSFSIYANHLHQEGSSVMHGIIREVSLVLAPANPGAFIDVKSIAHADDPDSDFEAVITSGIEFDTLAHSDTAAFEHADTDEEDEEMAAENSDMSAQDVFDTLTDEQQNVAYYMVEQAAQGGYDAGYDAAMEDIANDEDYDDEDYDDEDYDDEDYDDYDYDEDDEEMKHNVFDADMYDDGAYLSHDDLNELFATSIADAKNFGGSWKESFIAHAEEDYGIDDIDMLYPDYKSLNTPPEFIKREMGWVSKVINGVKHVPFTRIKSLFADITEDEARAKGYIKGKKKKTEVFTLLKRTTDPQTVYKLQKLDRDDTIDITEFSVVAWLRQEMRMMLDEEKARAILIGDGREPDAEDKISEQHIRPIATDSYLFSVKVPVNVAKGATGATKAKELINAVIRSRKLYKGSGNPTFYTTEDVLTELLLLEDNIGHKLYKSVQELATALRVADIVTCEPMEGHKITFVTEDEVTVANKPLIGIIVNLDDYRVGADKGGEINTFEDFDIDFNQYKYLIETRCSGALVKPFSALSIYLEEATA